MPLPFNMLSRFFIVFFPRSKCLLISWLQSPSAVSLEPKKIESLSVFIVSPSISPSVHIRWPKYFHISTSNENSGLISLKIDWFDLLAVQVTLMSLLQHHSSKASILWCSDLFMVQLSQLYVTTGKTIAFTIQIFISRVVPRVFITLSRFVIAFLPRSSHLISWLYSPSAAQEEEICHYSTFSPAICHEVMGLYRASLVVQQQRLSCSAGDPESGRSPGGGHDNHSSTLAWRTSWTEEPGGLHSMG